jgi:hypothetical protein
MTISRPPIPFADYQRIFRVLKSVLDEAGLNQDHACSFFSVVGAALVERVYKKRCQPVAGSALYKIDDDSGTVLSFEGSSENLQELIASKEFHCWILCDSHIIDFMAPLFPESLQTVRPGAKCSRKMFQKPLSAMAESPLLLRQPGDFYLLPDVGLTRHILEEFASSTGNRDLVDVCAHWYKRPPKNISRQLSMQGNDGVITERRLSTLSLSGSW